MSGRSVLIAMAAGILKKNIFSAPMSAMDGNRVFDKPPHRFKHSFLPTLPLPGTSRSRAQYRLIGLIALYRWVKR